MTGGCTDTDNNNADFDAVTAPVPRNSSSPGPVCVTGGGTMLFATISANPSTLPPGANTLLAVTVVPATTPPSTGITVTGDLTDIGGLATQPFYDDGTHGDATAGDNVFSFSALVPIGTVGGDHVVTANAADLQGRTVSLQQIITVTGASPAEDPLLFGNPSGATADIANENNYLMVKPQYSLSYNRSKATPNWVACEPQSVERCGSRPQQNLYSAVLHDGAARPIFLLQAGKKEIRPNRPAAVGYRPSCLTNICPHRKLFTFWRITDLVGTGLIINNHTHGYRLGGKCLGHRDVESECSASVIHIYRVLRKIKFAVFAARIADPADLYAPSSCPDGGGNRIFTTRPI